MGPPTKLRLSSPSTPSTATTDRTARTSSKVSDFQTQPATLSLEPPHLSRSLSTNRQLRKAHSSPNHPLHRLDSLALSALRAHRAEHIPFAPICLPESRTVSLLLPFSADELDENDLPLLSLFSKCITISVRACDTSTPPPSTAAQPPPPTLVLRSPFLRSPVSGHIRRSLNICRHLSCDIAVYDDNEDDVQVSESVSTKLTTIDAGRNEREVEEEEEKARPEETE
ncbi:unnamed protein product [Zymoseptoria tritici ST99CH_3D7]|uniref:Uncharacterized protein n=1 Tax=Zymoseptoria tritici (strain ST99CH_3D7) TaxID=1276538 RepID=A0A1X7S2S2_ZYMT9|nr:unnamed protein product [Zymoseptoria tritici ST99CH_3D7]